MVIKSMMGTTNLNPNSAERYPPQIPFFSLADLYHKVLHYCYLNFTKKSKFSLLF